MQQVTNKALRLCCEEDVSGLMPESWQETTSGN